MGGKGGCLTGDMLSGSLRGALDLHGEANSGLLGLRISTFMLGDRGCLELTSSLLLGLVTFI